LFPASAGSLPAMPRSLTVRLVALLAGLLLVIAACDSSTDQATTTTASTTTETTDTSVTTTTGAPVTSIPGDEIPGENSPSIPPDVALEMREQIGTILLNVEESRALPFLEIPTVTILDEADFTARVQQNLDEELDPEEVAGDEAFYRLLGLLGPGDDLRSMLVALYTESVGGFYDLDTKELVVPVDIDGISPLQEMTLAHELTHALTDQHFDIGVEYNRRLEEGNGDDVAAMLALVEGDATYQQLLYLESMDPARAAQVAVELLATDQSVYNSSPAWMQADLAFPYERGVTFTTALIGEGGLKSIDDAYQALPTTTEQIIDPNKYLRREEPNPIQPLNVSVDGWTLHDEGTIGEWGTRIILMETVSPGDLAVAAAGWDNDTYRVFVDGGDAAFVWHWVGESEEDAEDFTNALIAHSRDTMGAGGAAESGGGLEFGAGDPYVFIDRVGSEVFYIASTSTSVGRSLRSQLSL